MKKHDDNPVPSILSIDIEISHPALTLKEVNQIKDDVIVNIERGNWGDVDYKINAKINGVETDKEQSDWNKLDPDDTGRHYDA